MAAITIEVVKIHLHELGLIAVKFHDVNFWFGFVICRQQPERGPETLTARNARTHFRVAVLKNKTGRRAQVGTPPA